VSTSPWLDSLTAERERIGRASTAGRVADVLRDRVTEGHLVPGTRLSEEEIGEALGVSRNTLREAFRLLSHERLLEHVFNRGVFVRSLSRDDVRDVYRVRRLVECAAVRYAGGLDTEGDLAPEALAGPLAALQAAVAEGERAHDARDSPGIGTRWPSTRSIGGRPTWICKSDARLRMTSSSSISILSSGCCPFMFVPTPIY
jgi:DNA-binding GntR family transcriptional regulator